MALGSLVVKVIGNTSGLTSDLAKAAQSTDDFSNKARKSINSFDKAARKSFLAVGAAAAVVFVKMTSSIDNLAKTSDKLGVGVKQLQALRFAAEQTGVSTDTLDTGLQRMTRRVAEAATGTGAAAKALKELGLDAQSLNKLAPDESFAEIAEAMDGVANQGDRVRLAMQIFDTEGVALVNTMKGGKDSINAFKQEAEDLGLTLTRVDAAKVEAANDSLNRINVMMSGSLQQATAEFAPIIAGIAEEFQKSAEEAGGMGVVINNVMAGGATAVGVFADAFRGIEIIALGVELAFQGFAVVVSNVFLEVSKRIDALINGAISQMNVLINGINSIADTGIEAIEAFTNPATELFQNAADSWGTAMSDTMNEMHELAMQELPSDGINKWVENVKAKSQEAAEAVAAATKGETKDDEGEDSNKLSDAELEKINARVEAIRQANQTEQELMNEKYEMDQEALVLALENKKITQDEFDQLELETFINHMDQLGQVELDAAKAREMIADAEAKAKADITKGGLNNLASLMNSGSKKMFEIGKVAAISNAAIKGGEAATSAWAAGMSTGGPWAPVVAAAYTASSLLNTGSQIQQISSQSFGSKTSATSYSGGVPTVNTSDANNPAGTSSGSSSGASRNLNISLVGDTFSRDQVRSLIDSFQTEIDDGYKLTVSGG